MEKEQQVKHAFSTLTNLIHHATPFSTNNIIDTRLLNTPSIFYSKTCLPLGMRIRPLPIQHHLQLLLKIPQDHLLQLTTENPLLNYRSQQIFTKISFQQKSPHLIQVPGQTLAKKIRRKH